MAYKIENKNSLKFFFRIMNVIYIGFVFSSTFILLASLYLLGLDFNIKTDFSLARIIILILFVTISLLFSHYVYKKSLKRIKLVDQLILKLQGFQMATIFRLSIIELTLFIVILIYIFTRLWLLLVLSLLIFLFILACRPSIKKFLKSVPLSEDESKIFG